MRPSLLTRAALALGAILPAAAPASRADAPPAAEPASLIATAPAAASIVEPELAGHLQFLASDLMRGRDTASPEIKIASEYLATRLAMFGAEPAGDPDPDGRPTYFAHFPLQFTTPEADGTELVVTIERDEAVHELTFRVRDDFLLVPRGLAPGAVEAPLVFAGYGRAGAADGEPNDFEGLDVTDRIVLVLDGLPEGQADQTRTRRNAPGGGGSFAKLQAARERGALALIVVHPFDAEGAQPYTESNPFALRMFGRRSMSLGPAPTDATPMLFLDDHARDAIDRAASLSDDPNSPRPLDGARARFTFNCAVESVEDRNVIGLFPGSDDDLRHEVVLFSAHYDHVGVINGEIHNGADDNASGTSALLEIAQSFGEGPRPRRSVAFLWVSGEEKGLLGSRWWSENMTLPEGFEVVANINIDMVARNDPHRVSITPSPKHPDYSTIIPAAESALELEGMRADFDADAFYARTDSYNFARLGIPIIFFFSGIHEDYHKPTDVFEKADVAKAARIARAAYRLGWALAQADDRPRRIRPASDEADADAEAAPVGASPGS